MNRIAVLAFVAALCSCSEGDPRTWAFVQSVGGLQIDAPVKNDIGGWLLPISADVSGTKAFSSKPTTLNSALVCNTTANVKAKAIFITVFTNLPSGSNSTDSSVCPAINLGSLEAGTYSVSYWGADKEPTLITHVQIGL